MTRQKVAVVGCGHLGTIHARLLAQREDVELVAVVDPFPGSRDRVAAAHGCLALAAPAELVGRVSAAVIAAPTGLHAEVALPLLEAGIDLLIEKPLAATVEDARNIVTSARRHGRTVAVGHVERFNPAWQLATQRAGQIHYLEASRLAPFTFRSMDVGVVHDLMIHDIDLVLSLEPGRLEHVEAAGLVATGGHEDTVRARLVFSSGMVADLSASRIHPVAKRSMGIWSAAGVMQVDFTAKTVDFVGASPAVRSGQFVATAVPPGEVNELREKFFETVLPRESLVAPDANAIACEHEDFLTAIRQQRPPRVSAAAGAAALEVANQVIDSLMLSRFGTPAGASTVALPQRQYPALARRKTG